VNHASTKSVEASDAANAGQVAPNSVANASAASAVSKAASFAQVYDSVKQPLAEVESLLIEELQSDTPYIDELLEHSRQLGGKRMRPVLVLLSGGSCGVISKAHITMAAALEMIHLATLIHDDVIDESETRRHRPTAHSKWGNKTSVLLGDYLFTHSFSLASKADSVAALNMLAQASNRVCEGEMKQNFWQANFELSEKDYFKMIGEKTGELCSVGCRLGAMLSGVDENRVEEFAQFGRELGVSFQIIDDVLDLVGDPAVVGKTLGTDLVNQKPTLPIIHALATLEGTARDDFLALLRSGAADIHAQVMPILKQTGSIDYSCKTAASMATSAKNFAETLSRDASEESKPMAKAMVEVGDFILQRTF
jgi:octaprenyl-diphosphate synthase